MTIIAPNITLQKRSGRKWWIYDAPNVNSCYTRTLVIRLFIEYLHKHGQTDILPPPVLKQNKKRRIPHAFSQEELERFFHECDSIIPCRGRMAYASELRKIMCPVFFRLLYSSGIRTTEARFLMRSGVDLGHGVLDIQKSKGYDQHYVALHQSITKLLGRYDRAADRLCPDRIYFFESPTGQPYSRAWVSYNFSVLREKANGKKGNTVAYDLRHYSPVSSTHLGFRTLILCSAEAGYLTVH